MTMTKAELEARVKQLEAELKHLDTEAGKKINHLQGELKKSVKEVLDYSDSQNELQGQVAQLKQQLEDYRAAAKEAESNQAMAQPTKPNQGECIPHSSKFVIEHSITEDGLELTPSLVAQCVGVMRDRVTSTPLTQKELDAYLDDFIGQGITLAQGICSRMRQNLIPSGIDSTVE